MFDEMRAWLNQGKVRGNAFLAIHTFCVVFVSSVLFSLSFPRYRCLSECVRVCVCVRERRREREREREIGVRVRDIIGVVILHCQIPRSQIHFPPPIYHTETSVIQNLTNPHTRATRIHIPLAILRLSTITHRLRPRTNGFRWSRRSTRKERKQLTSEKKAKWVPKVCCGLLQRFFSSIADSSILPSRIPRCAAKTQLPPLPRAPMHSDPLPCPHPVFFQPAYS